jgi:hypothetical protein
MRSFFYVLAAVLLIFWAIGFYSTNVGSIIHILFVMAVVALVAGINKDESLLKKLKNKRE